MLIYNISNLIPALILIHFRAYGYFLQMLACMFVAVDLSLNKS